MQYPSRKHLTRERILFAANGFLLAVLVYCYVENQYEERVFQSLASYVKKDIPTNTNELRDTILLRSLHLTHFLEESRSVIFSATPVNGFQSQILAPITVDLMTGQGSCGSYSLVLGRLLKQMNIPVRFAQMKVGDQYGGHNLVEARSSQGWVVLDPLYDLFFTRPDSKLASFADVQANWPLYSKQVPPGYNHAYRYADVRYTNWDKIPVVMPFIKNIMYVTIGKEETNTFSFRPLFLKKFRVLFIFTAIIYVLLCLYMIRRYVKHGLQRGWIKSYEPALNVA